jgi:hypothetical protein
MRLRATRSCGGARPEHAWGPSGSRGSSQAGVCLPIPAAGTEPVGVRCPDGGSSGCLAASAAGGRLYRAGAGAAERALRISRRGSKDGLRERLSATAPETIYLMNPAEIGELRSAVERIHRCPATYRVTERVRDQQTRGPGRALRYPGAPSGHALLRLARPGRQGGSAPGHHRSPEGPDSHFSRCRAVRPRGWAAVSYVRR